MTPLVTFGRRLGQLAKSKPDAAAVIVCDPDGDELVTTWQDLDHASNRAARALGARGVDDHSLVVLSLPNDAEFFAYSFGLWKLGACVLPLNERLAPVERAELLAIAAPALVVSRWDGTEDGFVTPDDLDVQRFSSDDLPDRVSFPGKAIASGGSTGRPKIIVDTTPWTRRPGEVWGPLGDGAGLRSGQVQLVGSRLYHNGPFTWSHFGLFEGHTIVLMTRFDAEYALDLIERYRVNFMFCVPTMMQRMARVEYVESMDLSSIETMLHAGGPCPAWAKRAWFDLIGPEQLCETYGATEEIGTTYIRGDEWLRHPGSVGRPFETDLRILDDAGSELPAGEVGEIFMRYRDTVQQTFAYLGGARIKEDAHGFASVGDMGWVDDDGYLFLADRRSDLILTGGVNVYPAEIEGVLSAHPDVVDVAVVGLPDPEWGQRVHAVVQPVALPATGLIAELEARCKDALSPFKQPKSWELVAELPRSEHGKIRRAALVDERSEPAST